jgi:hypothetical protein
MRWCNYDMAMLYKVQKMLHRCKYTSLILHLYGIEEQYLLDVYLHLCNIFCTLYSMAMS